MAPKAYFKYWNPEQSRDKTNNSPRPYPRMDTTREDIGLFSSPVEFSRSNTENKLTRSVFSVCHCKCRKHIRKMQLPSSFFELLRKQISVKKFWKSILTLNNVISIWGHLFEWKMKAGQPFRSDPLCGEISISGLSSARSMSVPIFWSNSFCCCSNHGASVAFAVNLTPLGPMVLQ